MTDYSQLVHYIKLRDKGAFGWKSSYEVEIAGGKDYAYLAGHYDRLLDLALDWIPPALVEEIKEHDTVDDDRGDLVDQFRAHSPEHDRLYREEKAKVDAAEAEAGAKAEAETDASGDGREAWMGIESAPRDGTTLLGYSPTYNGTMLFAIYASAHSWWSPGLNRMPVDSPLFPTHWMPLPEPPAAIAAQRGGDGDE